MANVIILGGHGKIALLTAPLLIESGHQVTSVIRNPDHRADVIATGARPLVADLETLDTAAITELLRGHDVVVWSAGAGGGNPARTRAVDHDAAIRSMAAAQAAQIKQYVMVSYYGSHPNHQVPEHNPFVHYANAKAAADEQLRSTDLNWTILGPSGLTIDEPTGLIDAQLARGPLDANDPATKTSRANVALVIAAVVDANGPAQTTIAFADGNTPIAEVVNGPSMAP